MMNPANKRAIEGLKACVFDAYGTLFDFASAAGRCRDVLGDDINKLTVLWRDKQLQYTWLRAIQGLHADFWQVTGDALDFSLETLGIDKPGLRDRLMTLYLTLDPFPEVADVLKRLKAAGNRAAIKRTLEAYNRGNGLNLIALTAIKMDLHKRAHSTLKISRATSEDGVLPLPRLLKFSELKPDVADLVATILHLHGSTSGVIPSLYLHLANWPEFLSTACSRIAPLLKDGSIERARRDVVDLAGVEAKGLLAALPRTAKIAGYSDQVVATLDQFINYVIPEMLPVGLALDRAWPKQFDRALC